MESLNHYQKTSILTVPPLLDPCFKTLGFLTSCKVDEAVKRLATEGGRVIGLRKIPVQSAPLPSAAVHAEEVPSTSSGKFIMTLILLPFNYYIEPIFHLFSLGGLWHHFDATVERRRQSHNATAIIEVQCYLKEPHIDRTEDPHTNHIIQTSIFFH